MTETDIECGNTKATFYARGVNKSCKMIIISHVNSSNFNYNFKDNFIKIRDSGTVAFLWILRIF